LPNVTFSLSACVRITLWVRIFFYYSRHAQRQTLNSNVLWIGNACATLVVCRLFFFSFWFYASVSSVLSNENVALCFDLSCPGGVYELCCGVLFIDLHTNLWAKQKKRTKKLSGFGEFSSPVKLKISVKILN